MYYDYKPVYDVLIMLAWFFATALVCKTAELLKAKITAGTVINEGRTDNEKSVKSVAKNGFSVKGETLC